MTDEQHTVTGSDTEQGDKSDDGRYTDLTRSQQQGEDTSNQSQRQVQQNDPALGYMVELHIKQQEDDHDAHQRREQQRVAGCLFALELTAVFHVITFGQLDVAVHTFLDVVDYAPQVTPAGIGRNHNLPFHILPVDGIRSHGGNHIGHVQQGYLVSFGVVYHQVLDTVHRTPVIFARTDYQIESLSLFIDLRHHFAGHVYLHELVELRQGDTILRQHLPFRDNFQLRALYLLFHVQVGYAFHIGYRVLYLVTDGEHPVQVIAEQLDGDTGLCTAQHGVDTVADGLADFDVCSGQHREFSAYFGQHFGV